MAPPRRSPLLYDDVTAEILLRLPPDEPEHLFRAALVCKPWLRRILCDDAFLRRYREFHGRPFRVIFLVNGRHSQLVNAIVYSSATGAWSAPVSPAPGCTIPVNAMQAAVVGGGIYFASNSDDEILKCSLRNHSLSVMDTPPHNGCYSVVMAMGNTSLGFACIEGSNLRTWSTNVHAEGALEWVQDRVIALEKTIPPTEPSDKPVLVGYAEGVDIVFITTDLGLFLIKLNSGEVKKIGEPGMNYSVLPYLSFYTPNRCRLLEIAGAR